MNIDEQLKEQPMKKTSNPRYYKEVAKEIGVKHLIGKWGIQLFPKFPNGKLTYRLFRIIPLDGWITDAKGVKTIMKRRDFKL